MLNDGQPQPCTPGVFVSAGVGTVKALGQPGNMNLLNACARILYRKVSALTVAEPRDGDPTLSRGVFHGVEYQVGEGAAQLFFIAFQAVRAGTLEGDFMLLLVAERSGVLANLLD